jgi:hypothetical protein
MITKRMKQAGLLLSMLVISACGSGGGSGAAITPITGDTTVQASTNGVTGALTGMSLGSASLAINSGSTLKAADGTPVSGKVAVAATYGTNAAFLPATEQATLPAGKTLCSYISINMTGDKKVKTVNPPMPVAMNVALPDGTPVDLYSNSEGPGDRWVKEGSTTVSNGKVAFTVSHFTVWGAFQQNITGSSSNGTIAQ